MIEDLLVNQARTDDLTAIQFLLEESDLPIDGIAPHINNFIVVKSQDVALGPEIVIGCIGLEIYGSSALLRSLAVHPDLRKQGLGSRLVELIIGHAKKNGVEAVYLLTDNAEEFFKKRGFKIINRKDVPEDMLQSVEFTTLCPSSPCLMKQI